MNYYKLIPSCFRLSEDEKSAIAGTAGYFSIKLLLYIHELGKYSRKHSLELSSLKYIRI